MYMVPLMFMGMFMHVKFWLPEFGHEDVEGDGFADQKVKATAQGALTPLPPRL